MWWNLHNNGWSWHGLLDAAKRETTGVSFLEIVLSEFVYTSNGKYSSVCNEWSIHVNFSACQVSISNELLAWLIHIECLWQSLPSQVHRERISTIIREMYLSDLNSIISKEVVPLELKVTTLSVESEHLSVIIQELFLGWHTSATKFLLQELQELWVLLWWNWFLRYAEAILWAGLSFWLVLSAILFWKKFNL